MIAEAPMGNMTGKGNMDTNANVQRAMLAE